MSSENTPHPLIQRVDRLVHDLQEHLQHKRDEGLRDVPVDPDTVAHLSAWSLPITAPSPMTSGPAATSAARAPEGLPMNPDMKQIANRIQTCTRCPLCSTRTNTVPGQGAMRPEIMFVGEGPGADEDAQGLAFVGRAGKLLTKIIEAMGFQRDEVWIGNIVKCRPPSNRTPLPEEMDACMPYLKEQIAILQPKVIVCLGATAVKGLLKTEIGITKLRGQWMQFEGIDTMPTYHPAYLLRNSAGKRPVWEDMKQVLDKLGRTAPHPKPSDA